ncbi:MAG: hypothetical protein C7B47_12265 [Sulfobacillus thermosulfidooxidans]|uniref:Uncharacterized protein n=1 Tax=Sulfobacillus thermosulfidooxidans TaxID=28034 RepID=A0A2T2WTA6_SULTH|nr:MAG: hypothetical protein C7B47_12265 [Sulfobacillus thermosulfidooxidans]
MFCRALGRAIKSFYQGLRIQWPEARIAYNLLPKVCLAAIDAGCIAKLLALWDNAIETLARDCVASYFKGVHVQCLNSMI